MNLLKWFKPAPEMATSLLYDESTFYQAFMHDLERCGKEVIIESPFITSSRMEMLYPIFKRILDRGIKIHIVTRDPADHDEIIRYQATNEILYSTEMGINVVLLKGNHHRKLAVIDRKISWEGSLNILSQAYSKEIMRRIESKRLADELIRFLKFDKLLKDIARRVSINILYQSFFSNLCLNHN